MTADIGNTKTRVYDVSINGVDAGYLEKIKLSIKAKTREIKDLSQLIELVVGDRIVGMEINGFLYLREIIIANIKLSLPWSTSAGALSPTVMGGDMYDYAVPIKFHPRDVTGTTEDITISKCSITSGLELDDDGKKDSVIPIGFKGYPDRAQLPNIVFGQIG